MTITTLLGPAPSLGTLLLGHELRTEGPGTSHPERTAEPELDHTLALADLGIAELAELVDAFDVPRHRYPRGRSLVVVDLVAGTVSVDVVPTAPHPESAADRVLLAYLELLQVSAETAMPMPFTSLDLDVLRGVLGSRQDIVQRHLEDLLTRSTDHLVGTAAAGRRTAGGRVAPASKVLVACTLAAVGAVLVGVSVFGPGLLEALGLRARPAHHAATTITVPAPLPTSPPPATADAVATADPVATADAVATASPSTDVPVTASSFDGFAVALGPGARAAGVPQGPPVATEIIEPARIERPEIASAIQINRTDPASAVAQAPEEPR